MVQQCDPGLRLNRICIGSACAHPPPMLAEPDRGRWLTYEEGNQAHGPVRSGGNPMKGSSNKRAHHTPNGSWWPSRSVMKMNISEATEHLTHVLWDHLLSIAPEDPAIQFLGQVGRIVAFRDLGNLDAWETAVLGVFSDAEWIQFEHRDDFGVFESVWEVGRFNMFGAIDETGTRQLYQRASKEVQALTGVATLNTDRFDFSEW